MLGDFLRSPSPVSRAIAIVGHITAALVHDGDIIRRFFGDSLKPFGAAFRREIQRIGSEFMRLVFASLAPIDADENLAIAGLD